MCYSVVSFDYSFAFDWQQDLWDQQLADLGFDVIDGTDAYIPTSVLERQRKAIDAAVAATEGVTLVSVRDCPDENWNATWEAEHPLEHLPMGVDIVPHCAFGAGYHATTSMMIDALLALPECVRGKRILDNGTGTGVLAVMAMRCGAASAVAVDIDDHAVSNARDNALLNGVTVDVRLADTPPEGKYDLILSNIHRNILISQMPVYARLLSPTGQVWLSGFLEDDVAPITEAAEAAHLSLVAHSSRDDWHILRFQFPNS